MTDQHLAAEEEPSVPSLATDEQAPAAATPPGYLPFGEIAARLASQRWQFRHDNTTVPLAPTAGHAVEVRATTGTVLPLEGATVLYTTDGSLPDQQSAALTMRPAPVEWEAHAGYLRPWTTTIPAQRDGTVVRYRIVGTPAGGSPGGGDQPLAQDGQGFHFRDSGNSRITTFAYATEAGHGAGPAWASEAVIYQIFLDRFHSGSLPGTLPPGPGPRERHGGTLRGVRQALGYLSDLGVTCLWLSPLCRSETYHRYDATDLYAVDPVLGTQEDLRVLVADAHDRGLRVLLDLVPNHCSWHHPAFLAAQRDPAAATASWFTFDRWPDRYRSFLGTVPSLPAFNTDDPGARAHIIGSAVHWQRTCGVDGFRLDHAIGPGMDFWVAFRTATCRERPDCWSIGEATDTPDALRRYAGRIDAILDFVLARGLRSTFGAGEWSVAHLDGFLDAHEDFSSGGPGLVSFLDNHDMNRFLFVAGDDTHRLRLAALCQFSLQAVPTLYYGTEVGMGQDADIHAVGDAEARKDMPWDPSAWDGDLLGFYKQVIRLRTTRAALRSGVRHRLYLDGAAGTYAYLRSAAETSAAHGDVLAVFNLSDHQRTVTVPLVASPAGLSCLLATGPEPRLETAPDGLAVTLAPMSGALIGEED